MTWPSLLYCFMPLQTYQPLAANEFSRDDSAVGERERMLFNCALHFQEYKSDEYDGDRYTKTKHMLRRSIELEK